MCNPLSARPAHFRQAVAWRIKNREDKAHSWMKQVIKEKGATYKVTAETDSGLIELIYEGSSKAEAMALFDLYDDKADDERSMYYDSTITLLINDEIEETNKDADIIPFKKETSWQRKPSEYARQNGRPEARLSKTG